MYVVLAICSLTSQPCLKKEVLILYRGSYREINAYARKAKEFSSAIRMLVRLVVLHQYGRLTDNQ